MENFRIIAEKLFLKTRYLYLSCLCEPLLSPRFPDYLDLVSQYKIPFVSYATNGLLLNEKTISATLKNGINEVIISVDAATKDTYEKIRKGGDWALLCKKLYEFTEARKFNTGSNTQLRFNYTVMKENIHEIKDFISFASAYNPSSIQLRLFYDRTGSIKTNEDEPVNKQYLNMLPAIRKECRKYKILLISELVPAKEIRNRDIAILRLADLSPDIVLKKTPARNKTNVPQPAFINCQLPWFSIYLHLNGDMYPCAVYSESIGNIFSQSFEEIENSPVLTKLRKNLFNEPDIDCIECQQNSASGV